MSKPYATKSRVIRPSRMFSKGYTLDPITGVKSNFTDSSLSFSGSEVTSSQGNDLSGGFGRRKDITGSGDWVFPDIGGPFRTTKTWMEPSRFPTLHLKQSFSPHVQFHCDCPVLSAIPIRNSKGVITNGPPTLETSDSGLSLLGATAVARCAPVNSIADLGTALGELHKDGLPDLIGVSTWEQRSNIARGASKDYLNAQFGWLPLVSDIQSVAKAAALSHSYFQQVVRNNGRLVHRDYFFPEVNSRSILSVTSGKQTYGPDRTGYLGATGDFGNLTVIRDVSRKQWFSGSFSYHLPLEYGHGLSGLADKADLLLGTTLDPETLWNLAPWSWAIDWFSNVGSVIHNVTAASQYGQVMRYGYMMETTTVVDTYINDASYGTIHATPIRLITETKKRVRANPFGFGITFDGLNPFQVSILTALGFTRH